MKEYLELFPNGFDETVAEKSKPENWPWVGYSPTEGVMFTELPNVGPTDGDPITDSYLNSISYGVYWKDEDIVASADNMTKIGMSGLPIHNKLIRGLYDGNTFTAITDFSNVEIADNQTVVVEVPRFYGRSWQYDGTNVVRISETKVDDTWCEIPHCYVNAWCNTTGARATIMSEGGNYLTEVSLTEARAISNAANGVTMYYDLYKWLFIWLPVIEFGTFATTREYKVTNLNLETMSGTYTNEYVPEITVTPGEQEGVFYLEGTMGFGLVNHPDAGYNVTPPGLTICLGNRTGKVILTDTGVEGVVEGPCCAYSWRGFENVAGDISQWVDGYITLGTEEGNKLYIAKDTNLLTQSLEEFTGEGYEVVTIADELANTMCLPTKLAMGESVEFIPANNDMMGQIAGFQNGNNLSGMSDASGLFFASVPYACYAGSFGAAAAGSGAFRVSICGPGFLLADYGLSSGADFVGFRTVYFD